MKKVFFLLAVTLATTFGQRLPRPIRIHVSDRTQTSCTLTWSNPPGITYDKFDLLVHPRALIDYPGNREQPIAYISNMRPGVTYSVRLKGKTETKRSSSPTSFNLWSEPIAPSGLSVKPLADLRLKISLGSETQDFTAKIVGAKIEWSSVKLNNALLGYETLLTPKEGTIVYPDDMDSKDNVLIYTSLTPGREYGVSLRTKVGPPYASVYSQPITTTFTMPPVLPYDVKVNSIGASFITFGTLNLVGDSDGVEFEFDPPHGVVGDPREDPITGAYKLYTVTKLNPATNYVVRAWSVSHGVRSEDAVLIHVSTESAGRMDVVVNDFSHDSITVAIKDKKSGESSSQEYAIRYNNVDDQDSYIETAAFTEDSSATIIHAKITGLVPGITYRLNVIRSPSSDRPENVGEVVQTTIPLSPTLIKHSRQQNGLRIEYGKPDNGNCPNLKVYSSPGLKENSYRPSYRLFQTDEPIVLENVPDDKRYTVHARCVSGGIEGDETVFESLNVQMDFGGKPPKLACQELKIQRLLGMSEDEREREEDKQDRTSSKRKPDACCGFRPYVRETESCCGGVFLRANSSPKKLCCGDMPYLVARWKCCGEGRLVKVSESCERGNN